MDYVGIEFISFYEKCNSNLQPEVLTFTWHWFFFLYVSELNLLFLFNFYCGTVFATNLINYRTVCNLHTLGSGGFRAPSVGGHLLGRALNLIERAEFYG